MTTFNIIHLNVNPSLIYYSRMLVNHLKIKYKIANLFQSNNIRNSETATTFSVIIKMSSLEISDSEIKAPESNNSMFNIILFSISFGLLFTALVTTGSIIVRDEDYYH